MYSQTQIYDDDGDDMNMDLISQHFLIIPPIITVRHKMQCNLSSP